MSQPSEQQIVISNTIGRSREPAHAFLAIPLFDRSTKEAYGAMLVWDAERSVGFQNVTAGGRECIDLQAKRGESLGRRNPLISMERTYYVEKSTDQW